jgi:hypothetical protein
LWHSHTCNHSQEELAKFVYKPKIKVNKFSNHVGSNDLNYIGNEDT